MTLLLTGFLSALIASLVASFSGGGSSLILLPLLLFFAPGTYASLLTSTKVSASVLTIVSHGIHRTKQQVNKQLVLMLILFGGLGTALGTYFVQYQPREELFQLLLATTLLFTAGYLVFSKELGLEHPKELSLGLKQWLIIACFTFFVNILNGLFGGTGILMTLFCVVFLRMSFIRAIALTMSMYIVINITQTAYLLLTESVSLSLTGAVVVGSLIGSWLGTHLQYLKGNLWVKRAAIVMMLAVAIKTLFL